MPDRPLLRPTPEECQPPLSGRAVAWRLAGCLAISAMVWGAAAEAEWARDRAYFWAEIVLGVAAYSLVHLRRARPLVIALLLAALSAFSGIAAGPATLAAVSLATRRELWPIILVGSVNFAAATVYAFTAPFEETDPGLTVLVGLVVNAAIMGWGMFIGSRRELLWTLRQRALRAEAEQRLRVDQARTQERARIAREMHDVLAHQITQVSMTAGALAFRDDLPADQLRVGLGQVQERANQALHELRGVLGVLRDAETGEPLAGPQPTYGDVVRLVDEARRTGMTIELVEEVEDPDAMPEVLGRTVFRIVREGVTNVRRHAPGAHLHVLLGGGADAGLSLELRNALGFGRPATPGSGYGLVGLAERVDLRGGRLDHRVEDGHFVVEVWLPWTA